MKKLIAVWIAIMILSLSFSAYAAEVTVYAEPTHLSENEAVLIPVRTRGNAGVMGFKIMVDYPAESVAINAVTKGELTAKGNFTTNLGLHTGSIDVLWNNTESVTGDGTLFIISAQAKKNTTENAEIKLSFSQPDTFDERYQEVTLRCENIIILSDESESTELSSYAENTTKTDFSSAIDSTQITAAIKTALQKYGYKNLSDVENEADFLAEVNKNLETITGSKLHNAPDMESLKQMYKSAYEKEFISETLNNTEPQIIRSVIDNAVQSAGVKSIDNLKEQDKKSFVTEVEKNLKAENAELPTLSQDLGTEEAIALIEKLYGAAEEGTPVKTAALGNKYIPAVACGVATAGAIALLCIWLRKKQQRITK